MDIELITLNEHADIAQRISAYFKKELYVPKIERFADSEIRISLENPVRFIDKTIILIQSTYAPVIEHIAEVAFLMQELKNAECERIIGVIPYFGYSRQEKSDSVGLPGHAVVIAKLFESVGLNALISVELHDALIETFFSIPVRNVLVHEIIAAHIKHLVGSLEGVCLIAPDKGAQAYVHTIAQRLGAGMLVFSKERFAADQTRIIGKSGSCKGKTAIIIDDILDTGGTALNVCKELQQLGFQDIFGYFVHPVFSSDAQERIERSIFTKVFISNTIPLRSRSQKIGVFDVSGPIIEALNQLL
jgi:ribose-phosphate pyrophosphokinase